MKAGSHGTGVFVPTLPELIRLRGRLLPELVRRVGARLQRPGAHQSPQLGRGMEFAGVRPYQPGDDVRTLDWRHTARLGRPYTKLFHEERERPLLLLVDLGPSMRFGSRVSFKSVAAARAAAVLAWASVGEGDRVGGIIRDGSGHRTLRPEGRERGALALVHELSSDVDPAAGEEAGSFTESIRALARLSRPGTSVVILSDFSALDAAAADDIAQLARQAALSLIHVFDPLEAVPPPPGIYRVTDGQSEEILDLRDARARAAYGQPFRDRRGRLAELARRTGVRLVELTTQDDPLDALPALFDAKGAQSAARGGFDEATSQAREAAGR